MRVWGITWRVMFWTFIGPYWVMVWLVVNSQAGGRTWSPFNPLPPLRARRVDWR